MIRILLTILLLALAGCGGGSRPDAPLAHEIALSQAGTIVSFADTGKKAGDTSVLLTFDVVPEDYFKCVPNGHIGVMVHSALDQIPTGQYRGEGVILGNIWPDSYTTRNLPSSRPFAVTETWAVGAVPPEFDSILAQTVSPTLHDWERYRFTFRSVPTAAGNLVRYTIGSFDSGGVIDANPALDMSQQAVAFFDASGPAICPYTVRIIEPTATWSPDSGLPDLSRP